MSAALGSLEQAMYVATKEDTLWLQNVQRALHTRSKELPDYVFEKLWGLVTDLRNLRIAFARVQRWTVEAAMPRSSAAFCTVASSPSSEPARSHRGISQCVRRLQTRFVVNLKPVAVARPWRLRIPAMTASG